MTLHTLLCIHPKHHRRAPQALVLKLHGCVVVGGRIPQAARRHPHPLVFHLSDRHLHHDFVSERMAAIGLPNMRLCSHQSFKFLGPHKFRFVSPRKKQNSCSEQSATQTASSYLTTDLICVVISSTVTYRGVLSVLLPILPRATYLTTDLICVVLIKHSDLPRDIERLNSFSNCVGDIEAPLLSLLSIVLLILEFSLYRLCKQRDSAQSYRW